MPERQGEQRSHWHQQASSMECLRMWKSDLSRRFHKKNMWILPKQSSSTRCFGHVLLPVTIRCSKIRHFFTESFPKTHVLTPPWDVTLKFRRRNTSCSDSDATAVIPETTNPFAAQRAKLGDFVDKFLGQPFSLNVAVLKRGPPF